MLTAGHNSTTSALGICILAVARDADVQRRLRDDPALIPSAVDEFMRLETPVMAMPRWASRDTELAGRQIAAGDQLFLVWQSGNRDREFWGETADECILDRSPNPHLVFGLGLHRCIGDVVALLELRVTLEELLARTQLDRARGRAGADDLGALRRQQAAARVPLSQVTCQVSGCLRLCRSGNRARRGVVRRSALFIVVVACLATAGATLQAGAATDTEIRVSGTLYAGTPFQVSYEAIKPVGWNGTLVLDLDFNTWPATQRQWFLSHGYAIGGNQRTQNETAYEIKGYVDNLVQTRQFLIDALVTAGYEHPCRRGRSPSARREAAS